MLRLASESSRYAPSVARRLACGAGNAGIDGCVRLAGVMVPRFTASCAMPGGNRSVSGLCRTAGSPHVVVRGCSPDLPARDVQSGCEDEAIRTEEHERVPVACWCCRIPGRLR